MTVSAALKEQRVTVFTKAEEIYASAAKATDLWMGRQDEGIHLFRGQVVENDAPGSGRSDQEGIEPFVELCGQTVFRKNLHLDNPAVLGTQLAFIAKECQDNQATLQFTINGHPVLRPPSRQAAPQANQYWELIVGQWSWSRWYYVDIPPETLQLGDNVIEVAAVDGLVGWQLMVADYRDFYKGMDDPVTLPYASRYSTDGGQTWEAERGEYVLRLALDRFRRNGELVSKVIDAAGESDDAVKSKRSLQHITLDWEADIPESTRLDWALRTGSRPVWDADHWSDWQVYDGQPATIKGRYIQWKVDFSTADGLQSPVLKSVQVNADFQQGEQFTGRLVSAKNAQILRPSIPMPYEDYRAQTLRDLRQHCELDAVVAGAQTEFDTIARLHRWAYHIPLSDCSHFPWDPLAWVCIERDENGAIRMNQYEQRRRDHMCLYPNVVLVAACLSMGIPARHLNFHSEGMTGHEIAEVWSNDYGKWMHLDATRDYYWYDPKTLVPLDTQEIHQVLAERLERPERWDRPYLFHQDLEAVVKDLPIAFYDGDYEHSTEEGSLFLFRSFCHFRIVPRFDVFSRPRPLPVSQGTEVWSWNGYLNWADDQVPPLPHFTQHTNRRADFYPTLNQTRYVAEAIDERQIHIYLETETPGFTTFQVRIDGQSWQECPAQIDWPLHQGLNVLEMRTLNNMGVPGVVSALNVEV